MIIPFFIIVIILYPISNGVHGVNYAESHNEVTLTGELRDDDGDIDENITSETNGYYKGYFKGNLQIDDGTGWVFCNGKVRYSGELHINNAELNVLIHSKSEGHSDYQETAIDGNKGEMKEGIPFYFFGLWGSLIGLVIWYSWIIVKNTSRFDKPIIEFSLVFGFLSVSFLAYTRLCFISFLILIPLAVYLNGKFKQYKYNDFQKFLKLSIMLSIFILIFSVFSILYPAQIILLEYNESIPKGSLYTGFIGLISSAVILGFVYAKKQYLRI
jgi:hypothetical protein